MSDPTPLQKRLVKAPLTVPLSLGLVAATLSFLVAAVALMSPSTRPRTTPQIKEEPTPARAAAAPPASMVTALPPAAAEEPAASLRGPDQYRGDERSWVAGAMAGAACAINRGTTASVASMVFAQQMTERGLSASAAIRDDDLAALSGVVYGAMCK